MKRSVLLFALIIGVLSAGAAFAVDGTSSTDKAPVVCVPAAPQSSQMPMMQCPQMMQGQQQAITVDENFVYVVRGDQVLKLRKSDLALVATMSISEAEVARIGRGPVETRGTPLYPSGSWTDKYAPSGDLSTQMDRAYDYGYNSNY